MPALTNARHEQFCHLVVRGHSNLKAYTEAGFAKSSKSAAKLAARPEVQERINEIRGAVAQQIQAETGISAERVIRELEKMAFANMLDYIRIDDEGNAVLDFSRMTREQAAAIGEITTEETTNPRTNETTRRTKFKLLDKKGALVDIGRYLGMWVDRKEVKVGGVLFHVNADDMAL